MFGLPAWLLVFPVLGFLIFIHEFGHFATAKWFGITVKEFGFGFPPRLIGLRFSPHGTIYSINLVPIGGFVRMVGENGEEIESGALVGQKPEKNVVNINLKKKASRDSLGVLTPPSEMEPPEEVSFGEKSVLKRTIVLSAGAFMNLLFPFVIFAVLAVIPHDIVVGDIVITDVRAGSPAEDIGLRSQDRIVGINGDSLNNTGDLLQIIERRRGTPTEIEIRRAITVSGSETPAGYSPNTEIFNGNPKWFGITVKEFGFGFPPRLIGLKFSPHGTIYSINLVPIGGFVRMVGENGEEIESGALVGQKPEKNVVNINLKKKASKDSQGILTPPSEMEPPEEVSFGEKSVLKRTIVLSAGAFMNLLFPFVIFAVLAVIPHDIVVGDIVITDVRAGSPAEDIGLRSQDRIVGINGDSLNNTGDLLQIIERRRGTPTEIEIRRAITVSGSETPAGYSPNTEIFNGNPKWFGITVKEFGFGFPPRLIGLKFSPHGTIYSINLVPIGGFVRMVGENGEEIESGALVGQKPEKNVVNINLKKKASRDSQGILTPPSEMEPPEEVSFGEKSVLKRTIVLSAGAFMNLLFPFVIFAVLAVIPHDIVVGDIVITDVRAGSPAEEIGLRSQDMIVGINGDSLNNTGDLLQIIERRRGTPTEIEIRRAITVSGSQTPAGYNPDTEIFTVTPRKNPPSLTVVTEVSDRTREISLASAQRTGSDIKLGDKVQQGAIGVGIILSNPQIAKESASITEAIPLSLRQMWDVVIFTRNAVARWTAGGPNPGFTGPVGIAQVTGEIAKTGRIELVINLMALRLSIVQRRFIK